MPMGSGAECTESSGADREGGVLQELGSLGGVEARGRKFIALQFGGGEIDEYKDALAARGRAWIADCCSEHIACAVVVASS